MAQNTSNTNKQMPIRILIVASYNKARFAPFITEQAAALLQNGASIDYFGIVGNGFVGYLKAFYALKKKIREFQPDIIHAHYGLSGLLANLQRKIPVVTTYHGSDINNPKICKLSKIAIKLSAWNIFVSRRTLAIAKPRTDYSLLPCGVDLTDIQLTQQETALKLMNFDNSKHHILFAGAFDNKVKNYELAKQAIDLLEDVELLELKGYSREQVNLLMCAADCLLLTSHTEGSPQVIKEAMACGCPIVSVDVGDIKERVEGLSLCIVSHTRSPQELSRAIRHSIDTRSTLNNNEFTLYRHQSRNQLIEQGLTNSHIAQELLKTYKYILKNSCRS